MKNFITELQSLSEPSKQKIIVIATAGIMLIVIYFWLSYFNGILASASAPSVADGGTTQGLASAAQEDAGPWTIMTRAPSFLYGQFINATKGLGDILKAPRQYIVQPQQ